MDKETIEIGTFGKYTVIIGEDQNFTLMFIRYIDLNGRLISRNWIGNLSNMEHAEQVAHDFITNNDAEEDKVLRAREAYNAVMSS